eukprot:72750-Chlamydomonas_euryale.AAC.2
MLDTRPMHGADGFGLPSIAPDPSIGVRHGSISSQYELGETIGMGAHGRAMLARRLDDNEQVRERGRACMRA